MTMTMSIDLPEYVDGLPNIAGREKELDKAIAAAAKKEVFRPEGKIDFGRIKSACAIALHMHQPLIPAGGWDLKTAEIISNLKYMMDNQGIGDNHNAGVFVWCYKRIGEFVPQLIDEGREPRVMLEYSGTLFHGMRQMGLHDVFDALKRATCNPATGAASSGWAARGGTRWRRAPRSRTTCCTSRPGSTTSRRSSGSRRWGACAASRRRRWRCRTTRTSPTPSSRRCATAATPGCWCRSTPSSSRQRPRPGAEAPAAQAGMHQIRRRDGGDHRARQDAGLRHQAGGADAALLRGEEPEPLAACRQERAAAGHPDRRRRERRGDDERVPRQVHGLPSARRRARRRRS